MENVPQEFWESVEQFNTGQFYICHNTLEALWLESSEPHKTFYQGILQIAVALYHLNNNNMRGAAILLGEGTNSLQYYPSTYAGIDVNQLLYQSKALLSIVQKNFPKANNLENLLAEAHTNLKIPQIVSISG